YLSTFFDDVSTASCDLHSFPTRRSSDLGTGIQVENTRFNESRSKMAVLFSACFGFGDIDYLAFFRLFVCCIARADGHGDGDYLRSEEHTSELQSRFDIVCRLLLEKKRNAECTYPSFRRKFSQSNWKLII